MILTRCGKLQELIIVFMIAVASCLPSRRQSVSEEKTHVPILPSVKAKYWNIDPSLGYAMKNVGGGVYVLSDNMWQSAFLVTNDGVIVFDAPATFGKSIPSAIAKVTDCPYLRSLGRQGIK
jgi:hypothetical protein